VELADDATYLVRVVGSISFQTPLGDVHVLNNVLFVPALKLDILLVPRIADLHCMAEFDAQEVIFRRQTHVLEKGLMLEVFTSYMQIRSSMVL